MQDYQEAMLKSLVAVAWADGRVGSEETEVIDALLESFEISGDDAMQIREYAKTKRTLDDVPLTELSAGDRRVLLQHAVLLTYIDGSQSEDEKNLLTGLVAKLRIPQAEAAAILSAAEERAKRLVSLL